MVACMDMDSQAPSTGGVLAPAAAAALADEEKKVSWFGESFINYLIYTLLEIDVQLAPPTTQELSILLFNPSFDFFRDSMVLISLGSLVYGMRYLEWSSTPLQASFLNPEQFSDGEALLSSPGNSQFPSVISIKDFHHGGVQHFIYVFVANLRKLCEAPSSKTVDWSKWYIFWDDEHVVSKSHADSNYELAEDGLLSKVG
ncbi:Probable 6-phosphogluconolactonase 2 [Linum perenne]